MPETSTKSKMICPRCGIEMNHHSDKLVYPADAKDIEQVDPDLGGLVEEFHSCPKCGGAASRHSWESSAGASATPTRESDG